MPAGVASVACAPGGSAAAAIARATRSASALPVFFVIPPRSRRYACELVTATAIAPTPETWLHAFHAGDRCVLEEVYREHVSAVDRAVGRVLRGADRETVVHDVFCRLVQSRSMREGFRGGALSPWLATVAHNAAIDYVRRYRRETLRDPDEMSQLVDRGADPEDALDAGRIVERFRRERLPAKWHGVLDARFVRGLSQAEAARELGITRTTLAYQELRVRALLKRFVLENRRPV
jgi:RNA polymerase sigma-70 factor, ECF subfamily